MSMLTGEEVWKAVLCDKDFRNILVSVENTGGTIGLEDASVVIKQFLKKFITATPAMLSAFLEEQVTVRSLLETVRCFVKYSLREGLHVEATNLFYSTRASMFDREEVRTEVARLGREGTKLVQDLSVALTDIPAFLQSHGMATEEEFMISPNVGMCEDVLARYYAGPFTIADLLCTQPSIILQRRFIA